MMFSNRIPQSYIIIIKPFLSWIIYIFILFVFWTTYSFKNINYKNRKLGLNGYSFEFWSKSIFIYANVGSIVPYFLNSSVTNNIYFTIFTVKSSGNILESTYEPEGRTEEIKKDWLHPRGYWFYIFKHRYLFS